MNSRKITIAGSPATGQIVKISCVPSNRGIKDSFARQSRNGITGKAQREANRRRSAQLAEMLIAENFRSGVDLYVTLTYDRNPTSRKEAKAKIAAFNKRLGAARRRRGCTLKYIYCTESKHEDGRWHHHMILSRGPETIDELQKIWGNGSIEVVKLRANYKKNSHSVKDKTITNVAQYMCKEAPDRVGERQWNRSRNLCMPTVERDSVPEDWRPEIPAGAIEIETLSVLSGQFGAACWVKYWIPPER